jgi:hypothetical protein
MTRVWSVSVTSLDDKVELQRMTEELRRAEGGMGRWTEVTVPPDPRNRGVNCAFATLK